MESVKRAEYLKKVAFVTLVKNSQQFRKRANSYFQRSRRAAKVPMNKTDGVTTETENQSPLGTTTRQMDQLFSDTGDQYDRRPQYHK